MQDWQTVLLIVLFCAGLGAIAGTALADSINRKRRDTTRTLETLIQPRETVKAVCSGPKGRWILTSKRLILENGKQYEAYPFSRIQKVSGVDRWGKAASAAGKVHVLTVKTGDKELKLTRRDEGFTDLVKGLKTGVSGSKK